MSKCLKLYNTFTRSLNPVELSGKLITTRNNDPTYGSLYICGPTVYSDSHLGHALTYLRADLLRRFMKSFFNVRLHTVMNITDIDDKILDKTRQKFGSDDSRSSDPLSHPFNNISEKYYKSFLSDLESIKCLPADLYVKVSKHVNLIANFISRLEKAGHAYIAPNNDVRFRVSQVNNYVGRVDIRKENLDKDDPRDFVLWKAAKPGEPVWTYQSSLTNKLIPGRPGWHVQCSAISSALFGDKLDFHFGGKDLIFPHHYNEEACCCAYHNLDTSKSMHVWAKNWLHSGHLVIRDTKMSKSLGNVIAVNSFVGRTSINAIRLLCIDSHYRSDIQFNDELFERVKALDHKLNAYTSFLIQELRKLQDNLPQTYLECNSGANSDEIENAILKTEQDIIDGLCDDFHLDYGLKSILDLSRLITSRTPGSLRPKDLISAWLMLKDWCQVSGLDYGLSEDNSFQSETMFNLLSEFRQDVRTWALTELKARKRTNNNDLTSVEDLLKKCDEVRTRIDELGLVIRDSSIKTSSKS